MPNDLGDPTRRPAALRLATLGRDAVSPSLAGSRADLERLTAARIDAGLLVFILFARVIHLAQAAVDVTVGRAAYTHPLAAQFCAAACVIESALLCLALVRRGQLTMSLVVVDAVFGLAGLGALSFATSSTVGRTGTINWMLPYTVVTATAFGLLVAAEYPGGTGTAPRRRRDWRGGAGAVVLAAGYAASVSLPRLVPGEHLAQVVGNAGNYLVFFAGAAGVSIALRRQLSRIAAANDAAKNEASQLAAEAQWRLVAVDVFGPVLDLLDRATEMGAEVPEALRRESDRLIELIEATNPGSAAGDHR